MGLNQKLLGHEIEQRDQSERKERSEPKIRKMTDKEYLQRHQSATRREPGNDLLSTFCHGFLNCLQIIRRSKDSPEKQDFYRQRDCQPKPCAPAT